MSTTIAIINHKGGVGKTTSTINIGAGLARKGKKVLLIDIDPQANLTQSLDITDSTYNIYGALKGEYLLKPLKVSNNLLVIPSTLDLASAEVEMASMISRETILAKLIKPIKHQYDYILIDCPPSLGLVTINALSASDKILVPLQAQFLALYGLNKLLEIIQVVRKNINSRIKIGGIFITQYDGRKILNRDILRSVEKLFKGQVFKTLIRDNISIAEAPSKGIDIFNYSPNSRGATDYQALVEEILIKL